MTGNAPHEWPEDNGETDSHYPFYGAAGHDRRPHAFLPLSETIIENNTIRTGFLRREGLRFIIFMDDPFCPTPDARTDRKADTI